MRRTMRGRKASIPTVLAVIVLTTATACSQGSDSGSGSDGGSGEEQTVNEAAQAEIDPFLAPPEEIPLATPLEACPDEGKTIIVTENPQAVTRKTNDGLEVGAEMLGWTVIRQPVGTGPEDPQRAFDAALDQSPDAVLVSGNPSSTFQAQLDRAAQLDIPVLISDNGEDVGVNGTTYTIGLDDFAQTGLWGKMNADYAAAQGAKSVLVVDLSLYPILHAWAESAASTLEDYGIEATVYDAQVTDLVGGTIPDRIVSELQRNPDIDWVLLSLGDMTTGLDAALGAAGLSEQVSIGGESASTGNVEALTNSTEDAWTGFAAEIHGMYRIDALTRIFAGEDPTGIAEYSELPTQLLTPDNIGDAPLDDEGYYVGVPDYTDHFEEVWRSNC
jgi:ribose transport system substrate-binding protein